MTKHQPEGRMPNTVIRLPVDQQEALDAWAAERRLNRSILIREAIDTYLRIHGRDPRQQPTDRVPA